MEYMLRGWKLAQEFTLEGSSVSFLLHHHTHPFYLYFHLYLYLYLYLYSFIFYIYLYLYLYLGVHARGLLCLLPTPPSYLSFLFILIFHPNLNDPANYLFTSIYA